MKRRRRGAIDGGVMTGEIGGLEVEECLGDTKEEEKRNKGSQGRRGY